MTPAQRARLLDWYGRHRRELPWRRTAEPYRVWVSEVMLQQTTVRSVVPYYEAFLARFPSLAALATATEAEVLAAWSGLGYYRRARNLHRAARHLLERHAGRFPESLEEACQVPGIGSYTASAVLSIAYGQPLAVVDGNVRRVLARLLALRGPEYRSDAAYARQAERLLQKDRPGDWNQALMELGATVCLPRRPACSACPLGAECAGREQGLVDQLPERRPKRATVDVMIAAALVEDGGRVLLVRRPDGPLLGGLWEVPQTSLESRGLPDLRRDLAACHGLQVEPGPLRVRARHAITFRRITVEGYAARLLSPAQGDPNRLQWVSRDEISRLPVSSLTHKLLKGLDSAQLPLPV